MKRHITFNIWRYENVSWKNLVDKDIIPTAAGLERSWYAWDEYSLVGIMSITLSYHRCNKQNNWADGLTCYQIQKIRTHPICCFAMGWAAAKQIHMMLIYRGHKFSCVMYYQMSQVSHLHKEWGWTGVTWCGLTLKVLVTTIDAQWEGMGDVGSARYEPALLPPCPTIRVLSYSN